MAVKKIFVPLQNAAAAETSLKAAIAIARRHKAHIDALHIRQRPNVPAGGYYPVGVIFVDEHLSELKEALEAEAAALKEIFDRVMNAEGVAIVASAAHRDDAGATASWRDQQGVLPFDLPRSMDAVIASRPDVPFDTADPLFHFGHGLRY